MTSNLVRTSFDTSMKLYWYPGHMVKGMRIIKDKLRDIDLVIEVRDARTPLSSMNPKFEEIIQEKSKILVFNKADLAESKYEQPLKQLMRPLNEKVLFTSATKDKNVSEIIGHARKLAKREPERYPFINLLVVGMPNVGKSSLINSLRRIGLKKGGHATMVGPTAGVTRSLQTRVKIWEEPPIYLYDTPGIMDPHIKDPLQALKIALTGGTKDRLVDEVHVADYLLFLLNQRGNKEYRDFLRIEEPIDDINTVLTMFAARLGAIQKGGVPNMPLATTKWIQFYRDGKFGKMTLDDIKDLS